MQYYRLESLINLFDGYRKTFKVDDKHLLLLQVDGERYLVESLCPHRSHNLGHAEIQSGQITCPQHGYRFDLNNGQVLHASEEPCRSLHCYELVYQGNELGVMLGGD